MPLINESDTVVVQFVYTHLQYATHSASEMTYIVSGGALNSTHSPLYATQAIVV